jgi:secondary thiamine-phosphate synthase enzyme
MAKLEVITIQTSSREELVDITRQVQELVKNSGVHSGMIWVYSPHTTAGLTIQENADPDVRLDLLRQLSDLVPRRVDFKHREGNSDAHIKTSLMGVAHPIPFEGGRLNLGPWQAIYFCEFDGPRSRRVQVKVMSD